LKSTFFDLRGLVLLSLVLTWLLVISAWCLVVGELRVVSY
jgi:hypothetical protein